MADFGGEVLPEAPEGYTADYLFRKQGFVVELKSLTVDQTEDMNRKLTPKVEEWSRRNRQKPPGAVEGDKYIVAIKDMPPEIQDFWLRMLKGPVDTLIRDANRQIRDTKERMGLFAARGMVLIANESNLYHNHPDSFRRLVAEILRKRTQSGDLRYPHVNGAVYFSLKDVKSRDEGMFFWAPLQIKQKPDEDVSPTVAFQRELQQAWYSYIERVCEVRVRQHAVSSAVEVL